MATVESGHGSAEEQLKRLREEVKKKHGKTPEQLYEEREKRIKNVIELKEPDRVPVMLRGTNTAYFAARYSGVPLSAAYYDPVAWKDAFRNTMLDFEPDACDPGATNSGPALEALGEQQMRWPGGSLPSDAPYQFVERENMKENEYDLFLSDPTDFILHYYLPRVYAGLQPLSALPSLTDRFTGFPAMTPIFAKSEFMKVARMLVEAGQQEAKYRQIMRILMDELASLGFPSAANEAGAGGPPWDLVANNLRGMRGTMTDMFRRPEKLLAACEKIADISIARAIPPDPRKRSSLRLGGGGAIHRGADNFLSKKQFETFYWPSWKRVLQASIDLGFTPSIFAEAKCDDRLEYFLELPRGKLLIRFEQTDMAKAKAVLGGHACIGGNVPATLLELGSTQEVDEYCRNLIRICGKGGGFILSHGSTMENAKPANVKAMVESVKKCGHY